MLTQLLTPSDRTIIDVFKLIHYPPNWLVHALGLLLLAGRASHAAGMSQEAERFQFRVAGMAATFTVLIAAAVLCVVGAVRSGALF